MKRLMIDVPNDVYESATEDSYGGWTYRQGEYDVFLPEGIVTQVEDIPDPLPTSPGERFWGRSTHVAPMWWFVTNATACGEAEGVDYVAANGHRIIGTFVGGHGLVRLPDPEVAP